MFAQLGRFAYRRRRRIIAVWAALFVLGLALGSGVFGRTKSDLNGGASSESVVADRRLEAARITSGEGDDTGADFGAVVDGRAVDDPALRASVTAVAEQVRRLDGVHSVIEPYTAPDEARAALVSADGRTLIMRVVLKPWRGEASFDFDRTVEESRRLLHTIDAPTVKLGAEMFVDDEFEEQSEKDLQRAEFGSIPISLIVLGFVLAGVVAALLPVIVAVFSVLVTFLILLGVTYLTDVSIYALNVAIMFGLGLSFDYGLLMVNRFREERAAGYDVAAAVERTTATAGVTIAFSALTVAAALSGLFVFDDPILRSLAMGGVAVVVVALLAGITLLPALLGAAARRIKPAKAHAPDHGYFYRLSRLVQHHSVLVVGVVSLLLVLSALPFAGVKLEGDDYRTLPRGSETRAGYEILHAKFPGISDEPIVVVADVAADDPKAAQASATLEAMPDVTSVRPRDPAEYPPGLTVVEVVTSGASGGDAAQRVVDEIRDHEFGFPVQVTGEAAFLVDYKHSLASRMPWALLVIGLATFVLLFLMTGSVLVPIKAIVMNILSLGATFGVLVWVFQDGHLSGLLGFDSTGALHVVVPVIVFIFAFGLSMDYEVFLLSRIKEMHDAGYDNDASVAVGLQRTGRIITGAALLIVIVFAGFAAGELLFMKQMGIGLAVAVIVDATIVRSLLVPATMKLLGERNWWAPKPLRRIYDRIGLHEPPHAGAVPVQREGTDPAAAARRP
jgi:RND superfamily putative drug exporter